MPEIVKFYFDQLLAAGKAVSDPVFAYELLVHGPVLLAAMALLLTLALAVSLGRSPALRYTGMVSFALAALAAVGAWLTHNNALLLLEQTSDTLVADRFNQLLQWAWIAPTAACLSLLITLSKGPKLRVLGMAFALLLSACAMLYGGLVSYNHLVVHEPAMAQAINTRQTVPAQVKKEKEDAEKKDTEPPVVENTPDNAQNPSPATPPDSEGESDNGFFGIPIPGN